MPVPVSRRAWAMAWWSRRLAHLTLQFIRAGGERQPMSRMREFLYVSSGKLNRFGARRPRSVKNLGRRGRPARQREPFGHRRDRDD